MALGPGSHGFHVAGPKRATVDSNVAIHDGGMRHDSATILGEEVRSADGVLPVVVGEAAMLVEFERGEQQILDLRDLVCGEFVGGGGPDVRAAIMISFT